MKKFFSIAALAALVIAAVSCDPKDDGLCKVKVQLTSEGQNLAVEGVKVSLSDEAGAASFEALSDASGIASFKVPAGAYVAKAFYSTVEADAKISYNGSANIAVAAEGTFPLALNKVLGSQIIIKELYFGGCQKNDASGAFSDDAYCILYNNSDKEADASQIIFGILNPSNGHATNKFITNGALKYENEGWVPGYSAIWWFTAPVKIPAYSQIVVVFFSAIDNTATYTNSVNLSNPDYYWMSNKDIIATFKAAKYAVADAIPSSHYLGTVPFNSGTAWVLSNSAPAFFIGKAAQSEVETLVTNKDAFDLTAGALASMGAPKVPTSWIQDAVECWSAPDVAKSNYRFPAKVNTGAVAITNKQGYTAYRNVDKDATEAIAGNEGKIVYNYAGGTTDIEGGSTDPSGIDAEASIKAGAKIVYSDTNDSSKDFHQRKVSSLK